MLKLTYKLYCSNTAAGLFQEILKMCCQPKIRFKKFRNLISAGELFSKANTVRFLI